MSDSTATALRAAIAENLNEDTPRVAYADFLDEQGDHAQAEFIRLQTRLLREFKGVYTHEADALRMRASKLLQKHKKEWLYAPLAHIPAARERINRWIEDNSDLLENPGEGYPRKDVSPALELALFDRGFNVLEGIKDEVELQRRLTCLDGVLAYNGYHSVERDFDEYVKVVNEYNIVEDGTRYRHVPVVNTQEMEGGGAADEVQAYDRYHVYLGRNHIHFDGNIFSILFEEFIQNPPVQPLSAQELCIINNPIGEIRDLLPPPEVYRNSRLTDVLTRPGEDIAEDIKIIKTLAEEGVDFNAPITIEDNRYLNPLQFLAEKRRNSRLAEAMIECGASPKKNNEGGRLRDALEDIHGSDSEPVKFLAHIIKEQKRKEGAGEETKKFTDRAPKGRPPKGSGFTRKRGDDTPDTPPAEE